MEKGKEDLTFRPKIKPMFSEKALARQDLSHEEMAEMHITPTKTIPEDNEQNRLVFKSIPGVNKHLSR